MIINYKGVRIFIFSDTHGDHHKLPIPTNIDIIICAGDVVNGLSNPELERFFKWYASIPADLRIFVAGNHELIFDLFPEEAKSLIPNNIVLLENSGISYKKIKFYSVAARGWLHYETEIPNNTDILITHGPPLGILDNQQGCALLRKAVFKSKPAYHLFGHIHSLGNHTKTINNIRFCNVSYQNQEKPSKSI
ncbi:MAG: metallophosphatase domain-containing protein [Bacteroidales bacterium]